MIFRVKKIAKLLAQVKIFRPFAVKKDEGKQATAQTPAKHA